MMKPTSDALQRLIKSAARGRQTESLPVPSRTEIRVLGHWRSRAAEPEWLGLVPCLRRGLAAAWVVGALAILLSVVEIRPATPDAWHIASTLVNVNDAP